MFDHYDAHGLPIACDAAEAQVRSLRAYVAEVIGERDEARAALADAREAHAIAFKQWGGAEAERDEARAAVARAEQATTDARQRVLAICDEMAGGPERGCSGYADEIRDALAADVPTGTEPRECTALCRDVEADRDEWQRRAEEALEALWEIRQGKWADVHVRHAQDTVRRAIRILRGKPEALAVDVPAAADRCCDMHNHNCEPPSELCCPNCTEAKHYTFPNPHADGSKCVLAEPEARRTCRRCGTSWTVDIDACPHCQSAADLPGMWETADLAGGQTDTAAATSRRLVARPCGCWTHEASHRNDCDEKPHGAHREDGKTWTPNHDDCADCAELTREAREAIHPDVLAAEDGGL